MCLTLMIRPEGRPVALPDPALTGVAPLSIDCQANQCVAAILLNADAGLRWLDRPEPSLEELRALLEDILRDGHRAAALLSSQG